MTEFITHNHFETIEPIGKPSVITWNGVRMVASHSIQAVARELVNLSMNQEMVSINCIGKQSSGKTELMKTLSHLVSHKYSKIPWHVSFFDRNNIIELEETVKNLKPDVSHILIFDDIGFLKADVSSVGISKIEKTLSIIRHLPGGEDVKIILMKGFQYTKGETQNNPNDVKEFIQAFTDKYKEGNVAKTAVKIKLIQQGINCFPPRIVQACKYIDKMQKEKLISIDAIAKELDVTATRTILYPTVSEATA